MAFSGLIGALESSRIDTIANQITITPERAADIRLHASPTSMTAPRSW